MKKFTSLLIILILILILPGCSNTANSDITAKNPEIDSEKQIINLTSTDLHKITSSGTYELSGIISDGGIIVDVDKDSDDGQVILIFNGVNITSKTSVPVYIKSAKDTTIYLQEGSKNYLYDTENVVVNDDDEPKATIFSKDDLEITGSGYLEINANFNDGINCRDDLKITGGNIKIISVQDAVTGKDSVEIANASIEIAAGKDGIRATNETDEGKGILTINSGNINITKSEEGLEAPSISINNGRINIVSSDDGININKAGGLLTINGGDIYVNADGDGLDSNGSIEMTGGNVIVDGPVGGGDSAIDYDREFNLSGGSIVGVGSSGMAQTAGESSTQPSLLMTFSTSQQAGTIISLRDSDGNVIISHQSAKAFNSTAFSSPELKSGEKYSIFTEDNKVVEFTIENMVTYLNEDGVTTKAQGFGPGNRGGQRPENFDGQKFQQNPPSERPDKSQERMAPPQ